MDIGRIIGAVILGAFIATSAHGAEPMKPLASEAIRMKKATPILFVDNVQQSAGFFIEQLGFTKTIEVPYERGLQFAAVVHGDVEIMFQASDSADETFSTDELAARVGQGFIYFEIDDFDEIVAAVRGAEIVKDAHETAYGSKEIYIREPGGNVLGFAKHAD